MNSYILYIRSNYFDPLDEIINWDDIEGCINFPPTTVTRIEVIDNKLAIWKPQVISAFINNTFLNPLHGKLATKAESLTSLISYIFPTHTTKLILKFKK